MINITTETAGSILLVAVLVTYTLVYRFATTTLVDSLVLTVNIGTLTLLVPMTLHSGRIPQGVIMLVILFLFALPMGAQLYFQLTVRHKQFQHTLEVLQQHAKGNAARRGELARAFADLAELMIDPDCDPYTRTGVTYQARDRQRHVFLEAVGSTDLFTYIATDELLIPDGVKWGKWFRLTVGFPSVIAFLAACLVFLAQ